MFRALNFHCILISDNYHVRLHIVIGHGDAFIPLPTKVVYHPDKAGEEYSSFVHHIKVN
jgi:hypothetical protein